MRLGIMDRKVIGMVLSPFFYPGAYSGGLGLYDTI